MIAQIGWLRQTARMTFFDIHAQLLPRVQLSESQVRYLYQDAYLPLLACHERLAMGELEEVANKSGLLLTLDGLAPEGGEPQLWVVRELQTGLTLRCGWLSSQKQTTFENFLRPIADLKLPILAVMSDKQQGLPQAIAQVFKNTPHAFCQSHYFKNIAEPIAEIDQGLKVTMRKTIRKQVGALIRQEQVESPGVLTITGLIPSVIEDEELPISTEIQVLTDTSIEISTAGQTGTQNEVSTHHQSDVESDSQTVLRDKAETNEQSNLKMISPTDIQSEVKTEIQLKVRPAGMPVVSLSGDESEVKTDAQAGTIVSIVEAGEQVNQERDEIILDLTRRIRYLLTLKGRPPFRLAGLEMFERLNEVVESIEIMISHETDTRLVELCAGKVRVV